MLHSFARAGWAVEGSGGRLLRVLHGIADGNGWQLVLEADHPDLVRYYTAAGYTCVGEGELMPSGMTRRVMVRARPGSSEGPVA